MKHLLLWISGFILVGLVGFWFLSAPTRIAEVEFPSLTGDVEHGRLIFFAGGCASCHAAPGAKGDDRFKLAGGVALKSPFGTFYAPNISSDPQDGIGTWSARDLANAMIHGVSPSGRHYYPSFPYTSYQRMTLADIADLHAFLATLPAVKGRIRDHDLPLPFRLRRGLGLWKRLYLDGATFRPDPEKSDAVNRGHYLVAGPGHCGECHTPRTALGGLRMDLWLAGGPNPEGEGTVPNITPHETGIGDWSEKDIAFSFESGFTPSFEAFGGAMSSVQQNLAELPAEDRAAIAAYLKSLPPLAADKPQ